jgi:hypothetical protein
VAPRRKEPVFDPHEFGARRSDPGLGAFEPLPPNPRRITTKNLLVYFILGVIVVAFIREGTGRGSVKVDGSCTKPAFALEKTEVTTYGVLKWSAAGPADRRLVFGVDTSTAPKNAATGLLLGPVRLTDCKAHGRFGVPVPAGEHVLTAFLLAPDGTSTVIGSKKLTVNPN